MLRPDRRPARRTRIQHRVRRHEPALPGKAPGALLLCMPVGPEDDRRRHDRRCHRRHRFHRRGHGRRGSMSFHPLMEYDRAKFQKSERQTVADGPPFSLTPERRKELDEILTRYPPDRKRSAVLAALYLVQEQQGYLTGNAMRHIAPLLDVTPAEVEEVATYYVMFYREPVGKY